MSNYYTHLHCPACDRTWECFAYDCPACGGILETVFQYGPEFAESLANGRLDSRALMACETEAYIDLGQGNTPLVHAGELSRETGFTLYIKSEFQNPTGSFKDRPVASGISVAKALGFEKVVVASSGNGASAVAAFSAKARLPAEIYVPEETPDEKVKQAKMYGGKVIQVPGPYSNCYHKACEASDAKKVCNLTTTFINPFTLDGDKAVAYELFLKIGVPDAIYVPISDGPLLVGILKGYEELLGLGFTGRLPKMVGVQAEGCSPIARAFSVGAPVKGEKNPATIASGICDGLVGYEKDGDYTIRAIRRSGGDCLAISDEEIMRYQNKLGVMEGIFVEPSSASAIAAIYESAARLVGPGGTVVALLTGHGLKDMKNIKIQALEDNG